VSHVRVALHLSNVQNRLTEAGAIESFRTFDKEGFFLPEMWEAAVNRFARETREIKVLPAGMEIRKKNRAVPTSRYSFIIFLG
jgi:hypothetical protein